MQGILVSTLSYIWQFWPLKGLIISLRFFNVANIDSQDKAILIYWVPTTLIDGVDDKYKIIINVHYS